MDTKIQNKTAQINKTCQKTCFLQDNAHKKPDKGCNPVLTASLHQSQSAQGLRQATKISKKRKKQLETFRNKKSNNNNEFDVEFGIEGAKLPGTGESNEKCGSWKFLECTNCMVVKRVPYTCDRLSCESCYRSGMTRATKRAVNKAWQFKKDLNRQKIPDYMQHVVVSFPKKYVVSSIASARKYAYSLLKEVGVTSAVAVVHPWRLDEYGNWYESFHVHFITFGKISSQAVKQVNKDTGFVINSIRSIYSRKQLHSIFFYLLTHCAVIPKRSSYIYYGLIVKFKAVPIKEEPELCPVCGHELIYDWREQDRWLSINAPPESKHVFFRKYDTVNVLVPLYQ